MLHGPIERKLAKSQMKRLPVLDEFQLFGHTLFGLRFLLEKDEEFFRAGLNTLQTSALMNDFRFNDLK